VETKPGIESQTAVELPVVLHERRILILPLRQWAAADKIDQLISGAVGAHDGHRPRGIRSRERGATVVESGLQRMRAVPLMRRQIVDLQQLVPAAVTMLPIIPAAEVAAGSNHVGRATVAKDIAIVLLGAETRLQQRAGFERRLFVECQEPSALMKVGGRLNRVKGVQVEIVKLLWKERKADRETVLRINDIVEARKRIDALALDVAGQIQIFQTRHVVAHETIFEALKEKQLVLFDWPAHRDPRRGGANAEDMTVTQTGPRQRPGQQVPQLVTAGTGLDGRHRAGEFPILSRVRICINVHGLDGFERQLNGRITGHRVSHIQTRHQNAALAGTSSFDIQRAVRTAHYSG